MIFDYHYHGPITIKEAIESLGIPHSSVDLVLVNGEAAELTHYLSNSDFISVYPVFESFDISNISKIRKKPLSVIRFILDVHLGRLAKNLRMLGFDTLYRNDYKNQTDLLKRRI